MQKSIASRVDDIFTRCLFTDGEPTEGAVIVHGITATFGFHPGRLSESKADIRAISDVIVGPDFRKDGGGGTSFLNLCVTKDGEHWGEHPNCQELMCLAVASGIASYCLPREFWGVLQGGVPYVTFDL